ncbi:major capsid protein [Pseudomonas aeruginosa]|uniref:hypothetical protein n=1 Tax=Pseudomonas aeruginosa TaxID=287 RepID=UPI0034992D1A
MQYLKQKLAMMFLVMASVLGIVPASQAAGWDYSTLTSGIDFGTIATGVLAVAALLAAVYAGIKGARVVLGFLRS